MSIGAKMALSPRVARGRGTAAGKVRKSQPIRERRLYAIAVVGKLHPIWIEAAPATADQMVRPVGDRAVGPGTAGGIGAHG